MSEEIVMNLCRQNIVKEQHFPKEALWDGLQLEADSDFFPLAVKY